VVGTCSSLQTEDGYNIGLMMQNGTGIYGRGSRIETSGKALAFTLNGRKVFAKSVAGAPPRRQLYVSDEDARRAVEIMKNYIQTGAV
jgi:hypothetical protein